LLRHGETTAPERFHGCESDVQLSELGVSQAEQAANQLAPAQLRAVISSNLRRARETAVPIARRCNCPHLIVPDLHERRMGILSGVALADGMSTYVETRTRWALGEASHPGAESYQEIRDRVLPVMNRIARDHSGQSIAVVAHGVVIQVFLTSAVPSLSPQDLRKLTPRHAEIFELEHDPSWGWNARWSQRALEVVVAHLDARPSAIDP
jgi:broad specificity phosphatase PhoE